MSIPRKIMGTTRMIVAAFMGPHFIYDVVWSSVMPTGTVFAGAPPMIAANTTEVSRKAATAASVAAVLFMIGAPLRPRCAQD